MYPKDTEKWKQFTTIQMVKLMPQLLFCIPKILKNESNSQPWYNCIFSEWCCFVSQRYWKMKAIHNTYLLIILIIEVVLYPKDTEKWKQFTTPLWMVIYDQKLFCIPKILKNESNSQRIPSLPQKRRCCFVSQRYWKMKAIHNQPKMTANRKTVVLYPKDTEKWKQFTTTVIVTTKSRLLFCIPKILKNESNSQR